MLFINLNVEFQYTELVKILTSIGMCEHAKLVVSKIFILL